MNDMRKHLLLCQDDECMMIGTIGTLKQVSYENIPPTLTRASAPIAITLHNTSEFALEKARLEIKKHAQQHQAHAYEVLAHITPDDFGFRGGFGLLLITLYKENT